MALKERSRHMSTNSRDGMRTARTMALAVSSVAALTMTLSAVDAAAATCDRACLLDQAKQFNANMLAHTPNKIPLASGVQIRENTKAIVLADSRWAAVTKIRSEGVYADAVQGTVIEHVAAETEPGKTVYIGARLKVVDSKITEVEMNFDDRPNVNAKNLIPYDPVFNTLVPPEQRV